MISLVRGAGGLPSAAMGLVLAICGLSGRPAMAQGVGGGPAVYGGYSPGYGTFGPGYPGFGLEYGQRGCFELPHARDVGGLSLRNWCSYVVGKECLYPYVADPYSDPAAALGFWPPYSAPVAVAPRVVARVIDLGIDEEPVVDAEGAGGVKVARVYPGTAAARAGIQAGDVLHAINGYSTRQRGNLAWIIANAAPDHVLQISLRSVRDGREHTVTAETR